MVTITHLLPVLSLLATSLAIPMEYDYSPAPAASAPAQVAPQHQSAAPSAASTIPYDEAKQHSIIWGAWSQTANGGYAAPTQGSMAEGVKYGSGSTPVTDLNSCLQVCQATYGGPSHAPAAAAPPAQSSAAGVPATPSAPPAVGGGGGGVAVTHTVIVAPTQGVLRFVPFSVTAKEGDSLEFVWGAGPHSATLSQGQNVCNKSSTADSFDSVNATAKYVVKVNSTKPSFHYCTVGMHCANGMYGIVNPPTTNVTANLTATRTSVAGAGSTAGSGSSGCNGDRMDCWIANWAASAPEASATVKAVQKACEGSEAWKWGAGLEMSGMLGDAVTKKNVIENVMYTRLMMSMNPSMLSPAGEAAAALPARWVAAPDLKSFVQQSEAGGAPPASGAAGGASSAAAVSASASGGADVAAAGANTSTSGAGRLTVPTVLLGALSAGLAMLL